MSDVYNTIHHDEVINIIIIRGRTFHLGIANVASTRRNSAGYAFTRRKLAVGTRTRFFRPFSRPDLTSSIPSLRFRAKHCVGQHWTQLTILHRIFGISTLSRHSIDRHYTSPTISNYIINKSMSKIIQNFNKISYYVIYKLILHSKLYN